MVTTEIQLPDPLFRQLNRIAEEHDWSMTEVIRRAGELLTQRYPENRQPATPWQMPAPLDLGETKMDVSDLREEADAIEARSTRA